MAGLIFYDINSYTSWADVLAVLKTIPNFWDEISETTLTKGGITLSLGDSKTLSGYGLSAALNGSISSNVLIAATNKGLLLVWYYGNNYYHIMFGCDKSGNWGAGYGNASTSSLSISHLIADNLTSASVTGGTTYASETNTQIIDLAADKGNFIFDDIRRVLYIPSGLRTYNGKLTMPNGEKYVKCGAFVLRYTE